MKLSTIIVSVLVTLLLNYSKSERTTNTDNSVLLKYLKFAADKNLSYDKRLYYCSKSFSLLCKAKNDSLMLEKFVVLNYHFSELNSLQNLKYSSKTFLNKIRLLKSDYFEGYGNRSLGKYYELKSMNDSAYYYYHKAQKNFTNINYQYGLCHIYYDQAQIQFYINDYLGSEKSLIKVLKIAKKNDFFSIYLYSYLFLGINSCELGYHSKAFEYYNKALELINKNPSKFKNSDLGLCFNNIGYNYIASNDNKKAIEYLTKAMNEEGIKKLPYTYVEILDNLGYAQFKSGNLNSLPKLFLESQRIREEKNILNGKNFNKLYLSKYYSTIKDTTKAKDLAIEALSLSQSFRAPKDMMYCLKHLASIDHKNALKYTQHYIKISDSMQILERKNRDKFAKIAYETEEITNEKESAVYRNKIFISTLLLLILLSGLLFFVISQRIKQKELIFVQSQQQKELEIYQLIQNQQIDINRGREIEKKRIARDLHDSIMNRLSSTRLNLHILKEDSDSEVIKRCLPFIKNIQNIEKEIRNISHDLNKDAFLKDSFIASINSLFDEQTSFFKNKSYLEIDPDINWNNIQSSIKIHIYRIFQEALQNVQKHAKADIVIASMLNREEHVLIEIYDDGIGFSSNKKKKGIGLQNIYSRIKSFNGSIEIKSDKIAGTTIIVSIPKQPELKTT